MPFVRFSRDPRGCDHVFLLDIPAGATDRHPRVLYWHRCPTGLKMCREPFHPTVRRELERAYPDVHFDWDKLAALKPPPITPTIDWRERRREARARKAEDRSDQLGSANQPPETREEQTGELDAADPGDIESGESADAGVEPITEAGGTAPAQLSADPSGRIQPAHRRSRPRRRRRPPAG